MILLRTLRKDYVRYTKEAELDDLVRYTVDIDYVFVVYYLTV